MEDQKNLLLAIGLSLAILLGWQYFYAAPKIEAERERIEAKRQAEEVIQRRNAQGITDDATVTPDGASIAADPAQSTLTQSRDSLIVRTSRVPISSPKLAGSINLTGGRIDDLSLTAYHESVEPGSPNIVLFSPSGSPHAYYAEFRWATSKLANITPPDAKTVWTLESGATLTPQTPIVLRYDGGDGVIFRLKYAIDNNYLFTIEQSIENGSGSAVGVSPFGVISRHETPVVTGFYILHEGLLGFLNEKLQEIDYEDLKETGRINYVNTAGWLGITDKYWAAALIPDQAEPFTGAYRFTGSQFNDRYQVDFLAKTSILEPGGVHRLRSHLFAGAKEVNIVDSYQERLGVQNFELLIDWGWFHFITKPLFFLIDWLFKLFGNFGVAILAATVLIKLVFFPLANKSYVSMSRMKLMQPQMKKLQERFSDDKAKLQQEMMALYKREKINPLSGCLPILVQIPVFFALYKVLLITIEMRHAPFFGWIKDLAAPDPTSLFNLFGLLPYDVPMMLMIGVWPLLMGITMFLQMRMNPTPPDPTQAMIFNWMPVLFTFLLANFPAGLVIYWTWNNILSILQQGVIMHRQGAKVELLDNIMALFGKKRPETSKASKTSNPPDS